MAIILKANKVNLFVSFDLFVFWYHSPNFLDTPLKLPHVYPSVSLSVWKDSANIGRIFMEFNKRGFFFEDLSKKFNFD
jgi:hypothetical protein